MTLWIILTALAALTAAWLTIPLVRRHEARVDARAATIAVLKDQLADVDVQLAAGTLPPAEAEAMRTEIRRRMLAAGHIPAELDRTLGQKGLSGAALGLAFMVALAGAALYASMGRPDLASGPQAPAAAPAPEGGPPNAATGAPGGEIAQLIAGLEQKMQAAPDDPEGWRMLGWSYFQTGRYADAAGAYAKAIAIKPDGPGYQSAYGEALVQAAGGRMTPDAVAAFEKARAQDGADARARYFLAVAKAERGDRKGAIDDWLLLLADSPADAPWVPQLRSVIETTARDAGIDIAARLAATQPAGKANVPGAPAEMAAAAAAAAATAPPAGVMPGPSRDQVAAAQSMSPDQRSAMIRGMVDGLAEKLKANPKDEAGWLRLMRARQVLGEAAQARAARDQALAAFQGDAAAQGRIRAAATDMGL